MDQRIWTYRVLVEIWVESRAASELPLRVRARVRDLDSDEPRYVGSMAEIEQLIDQRLDAAGLSPRRWEHEP